MTRARDTLLLLLAGLCLFASAPSARSTDVYPKHPRLLFRADELDEIRERCQSPLFAPLYAVMKKWADDRIETGDGKGDVVNFAFLYQMEGGNQYLEEAKTRFKAKGTRGALFLDPALAMKFTYDLIYNGLSTEEKATFAQQILGTHMTNPYKGPVLGMHQIGNEASSTLAVWGDQGVDMEQLRVRFERERDAFHNQYYQRGNVIAERWGGWHRSFECRCWRKYVPMFADLWLNATGEDTFDNPLIRGHGAWYLYHTLPGFLGSGHFRMVPDSYTQFGAGLDVNDREGTLILGRRLDDGLSMWWWKQALSRSSLWGFGAYREFFRTLSIQGLRPRDLQKIASTGILWRIILYYDPEVELMPPETFPEDAYHRGMGLVSTRAGWHDDAAFAFFHCGRMASGKPDDLDNNNFFIYRNGYLATDGWPPGKSAHYGYEWDNYRRRTIAHNLVTVYDPDESLTNFWNQYSTLRGPAGKAESNDGGQMGQIMFELDPALHPWKEEGRVNIYKPNAEILSFRTTPQYTYVKGDATKSYSPHKLESFTREFVFLKPDTFVVFDRVASTQPGFKKRWHIHPMQKPELGQNTFRWQAYRPGTNLRKKDDAPLGWLTGTTLLPEKAITTIAGGKGKECWIEGKNYHTIRGKEISRGYYTKSDEAEWKHSWRIDVTPKDPSREDLFLHVLQTFPDLPKDEAKVALIKKERVVGATLTMGRHVWEITFARDGGGGGSIQLIENENTVLQEKLPTEVEDTYKAWNEDPRYMLWRTDSRYRIVIPEEDRGSK